MTYRGYCAVSAAFFTVVAVAHLLRIVFAVPIDIGGVAIPSWVSGLAVVVPGILAAWGFRLARA